MKKLFLSMLAAVTLFASCSEEELVSKTSGESLVNFTVTTPELGSRALGEGIIATDLYYAVYDETTEESVIVDKISNNVENSPVKLDGKKANIVLPLLNGHNYSLLFWAENKGCAAEVNWENKTISIANTLTSNQEAYDAFYAYVPEFTVTGDKHETIELKRPFAQLNIGTTAEDIARVKDYCGAELTQTKIEVNNVPTSMNLATGEVTVTSGTITYDLYEFAKVFENEVFPVTGYQYISMNYILVGSTDKTLVDITLSTDVKDLEARTYANVPVQGNYRTNIYGTLFTSNSQWDVEIEDNFGTPSYEVLDGVIDLSGDLTINESFRVENSLAINLNGHKLSYGGNDIMIRVDEGAKLTFNGPGEVVSTDYIASVNKGGEIYVNGGSFTGSTTCFNVNGGNLYIAGGSFNAWNEEYNGVYTLNLIDGTNGKIEVTGGSFYKFDPAKSKSENQECSFVKEGYKSVKAGDYYEVIEGIEVKSADDFKTALETAEVLYLSENINLSETFSVNKDVKIYLNEYNFDASTNTSRPFNVENGKLTIIGGSSTIKVGAYGLVNVPAGSDAEIVLEGGIYEGNTDNGAFIKPRGEGKINVTLNNVKYTDSSTDGYVLNCSAYNGNDLIVEVVGGEYVAGGGFNGLPDGSSIKNATVKNTNPNQEWNAVEVAGYDTGDVTANVTIENSTIISTGYAVTTGFGAIATVKNCVVNGGTYAYCVYPTGGTINVTGGSYTGDLYLYPFGTNAVADSKIVINDVVKMQAEYK